MTDPIIDMIERARLLVGMRPAAMAEWAHSAKIQLVANALQGAYAEGYDMAGTVVTKYGMPTRVVHGDLVGGAAGLLDEAPWVKIQSTTDQVTGVGLGSKALVLLWEVTSD